MACFAMISEYIYLISKGQVILLKVLSRRGNVNQIFSPKVIRFAPRSTFICRSEMLIDNLRF